MNLVSKCKVNGKEIDLYDSNLYVNSFDSSLVDLDIQDTSGNILIEFSNGHIKTKNFDSENCNASLLDDIHTNIDELSSEINSPNYMAILRNVCCIGDSLTAGCVNGSVYVSSKTTINEGENWPAFVGNYYNRTYTNIAIGASRVSHWRYLDGPLSDYKPDLTKAKESQDAYFVFLGTNDAWGNASLGTIDDIKDDRTSNENSFYGNYDWLIRELHSYNEYAKIFLMTLWRFEGNYENTYDAAIREVCNKYDYCYLIDQYNDERLYSSEFTYHVKGNHLTPIGYQIAAEEIIKMTNKVIKDNIADFLYFPFHN